MANRLAAETSPYLRQHADNPVDWYPWGPEALERARELERPILLSIGYAACHWCHVMAHESFEDPGTAAVMNRLFVNIKVDREERPDLDAIYMQAVTTMTGRGGWPMTVFLTPAGEPFFGGTYFPPEPRDGSPSFTQVLEAIAETWADRRDNVEASAAHLTAQIARAVDLTARARPVDADVLDRAASAVAGQFDPRHGGFGRAPKFPLAMTIEFLLRHHLRTGAAMSLQMAEVSLERMARGGIYDQLGGGFARYSTDDAWLVPHFEKMLYDNALLARVYLHAWRITGRRLYRRVVEETLDWLLREMAAPGGGFYSSLDADSEGEEGRYYVWDAAELRGLLGADYEPFARVYGVTESGNWEGRNVLHLARTGASLASDMGVAPADLASRLVAARRRLVTARARRVRPSRDEKVITAWNGLALAALAEAGRALGRADLLAAAERCAAFLHGTMRGPGGRLHRTWSVGGTARLAGYLEDHAAVADGLVALYQATFDTAHLAWARELAEVMVSDFGDDEGGGFFDTADDHEELIRRPKEIQDNATPSGNALAATVLLDLARYTGDGEWWQIASEAVSGLTEWLDRAPTAFAQWLQAAWVLAGEPRELAVVLPAGQSGREAREGYWYGAASAGREAGSGAAPAEARPAAGWGPAAGMLAVIDAAWRPDLVVAVGDARDAAEVLLLADRPALDGRPTAYLCHRWACDAPTTDPATLVAALGYGASRPPGDAGTGGTPSGALAPGEQGAAGGAPTESRGA